MNQYLHIISFDVPFPANYGGVIDVFYKLVALKEQGVKVYLHCFTYGREQSPELEKLCEKVFYYERKTGLRSMISLLPYNVKSRQSEALEKKLLVDNFPILFEVLHTCYLLDDPRFKNRLKVYRHSNIEHHYYAELSRSEKSLLKKIYLRAEAWKLRRFEKKLRFADLILAVNKKDTAYFREKFPAVRSDYLPSFHANHFLDIKIGSGSFILFHGNLSVSENYQAAEWLIKHVFSALSHKCIVAGLNPPAFLSDLIKNYRNVELIENPDEIQMNQLVHNAQIHVLFTAQPTGLKLKLVNVLFNGRFVVCNSNMISGTNLLANDSLVICERPDEFIKTINKRMLSDFSETLFAKRKELIRGFDNTANCRELREAIFGSR